MDKIVINLNKIKKAKININEYLALIKLNALSRDSDIPYHPSYNADKIITDLKELGYIELKNDEIILTDKATKIISGEDSSIDEVLVYFKEVTGKRKLDINAQSNRRFVRDRLNQGYSKEDLKAVIDLKFKQWNGTSMAMYIRLETLFNQTKFQKYIGEIESIIQTPEKVDNFKRI